MKALGLIGGTSWHSTVEYYKFINQYVNEHFGDNTNPPLLVFTLNHALMRKYQGTANWEAIANDYIQAANRLQRAGAEALLFCANTPHKIHPEVSHHIEIPILHIADATAQAIHATGVKKVGFLGTRYTMQEPYITNRIAAHGIEVEAPKTEQVIVELHRIIMEELTYGKLNHASKNYVLQVIQNLINEGAEGIVLGCTEFPILIQEKDLDIPIFNTADIHAKAGADFILS